LRERERERERERMTNDKGGDENQIFFLSTGIPQPIKLGISSFGSSFKIYKAG